MELIAGCNFSLSLRRPVRFGPEFRKASARSQRREDQRRPRKLFTPEDIHLLLDEAGVHVQAMLLLGDQLRLRAHRLRHAPAHGLGGRLDPVPKTQNRHCTLQSPVAGNESCP